MSAARHEQKSLSGGRRRLFAVVAVLLPFVLLAVLELALRLTGVVAREPLFVPVEGFEDWRVQNERVAARYFPPGASLPTGLSDVFRPGAPSDSTLRIVVQGGSSAAGYPYFYGAAFSRMLALLIENAEPSGRVEVINTGLSAVNSYTLLDLAPEIVAIRPHAVLIYAGHNEFYGVLGVGSSQTLGRSPALVNFYLDLQRLHTVRLLERGIRGTMSLFSGGGEGSGESGGGRSPGTDSAARTTLMERMVGEQRIPLSSDTYQAGLDQFSHNMERLIRTYTEAGIAVFVSTVASNEGDMPPFENAVANEEAYTAAVRQALSTASGASNEALGALTELIQQEPDGALAYYARGLLHRRGGRMADARRDFVAARDRDALRFRASSDVNEIIQRVGRLSGATVVDAEAALRSASTHGIIGKQFMLEHLHPNVDGYFVLANAFRRALTSEVAAGALRLPEPFQTGVSALSDNHPAVRSWRDNIAATPLDRRFGQLRLLQLQGNWPFQEPGIRAFRDTLVARTMVDSLALPVFRGEMSWQEGTSRLSRRYAQLGFDAEAVRAARALQMQFPFLPGPNAELGARYAAAGLARRALDYYRKASDIEETPELLVAIGNTHITLGDGQAAEAAFVRALALRPSHENATIRLAALLAASGRGAQAVERLRRDVDTYPDHGRARAILQRLSGASTGN